MENSYKLKTAIDRLKVFSCPDFKDVYSSQYFENVIKPSMALNSDTYSVIFGDFNRLSIINDVYGEEFGDKSLALSIKLIKKCLKQESMIVRAGGDEFYIIIPSCNKEKADVYCKNINSCLSKNAALVGGLSIELASVDSTSSNNIDKLIDLADEEVTKAKVHKEKDSSPASMLEDDFLPLLTPTEVSNAEREKWTKLNEQINISVYNFLQNFRPSKTFKFEKEQILDLGDLIISALSNLQKAKNINIDKGTNSNGRDIVELENQAQKEDSSLKQDEKINWFVNRSDINDSTNGIDISTSKLIHLLVTGKYDINQLNLSKEDRNKLLDCINDILKKLVKDKTGLLSETYFKRYLSKQLSNPRKPLAATYISTSGITLSNLALNHTITDERLNKTCDALLKGLKEENIKYNDTPFIEDDNDTFVLSHGAGNYSLLYPATKAHQVKEKVNKTINNINDSASKDESNQLFKMTCYSTKNDNFYSASSNISLVDYVKEVKEFADLKKDILKKDLFKSKDAYTAFYKSINKAYNYYLNNIPEASTDIKKISTFTRNVYTAFLNQEVLHNQTRDTKKRGIHSSQSANSEIDRGL